MNKNKVFFIFFMCLCLGQPWLFSQNGLADQQQYLINIDDDYWIAGYQVTYSGDYSGEASTPFTIGPHDKPFTVTLEIVPSSCAGGMCVVFIYWTINNHMVWDNVITLSTTPENPEINIIAHYVSYTPPPNFNTPRPNPESGLGDVNNDGKSDIIDALLVAQFYVNYTPVNFNERNADVNCDRFIDIIDALLIAQYYVGMIYLLC